MNQEYPTLDHLLELGFESLRMDEGSLTLHYQFRNLDLVASPGLNMFPKSANFGVDGIHLMGVMQGPGWIGEVEYCIPKNLQRTEEVKAWISYALRSRREKLGALPPWFLEGERLWDLIPHVRERREREAAWKAAPKCTINRDYARPLRRKLKAASSAIECKNNMLVSFDGRVLTLALCGELFEVIATGERWEDEYLVEISGEMPWPRRFKFDWVTVSIFEGSIRIDGHPLGPCRIAP